jgi:hypothetical protein
MEESKIIQLIIEWAEHYFKSKDAFYKKIISIKKEDNGFIINYKEKKETLIALPELSKINQFENINKISYIITLNNRKNIDYLYNNWSKLVDLTTLKIYFINPFSTTEKRWIISPNIHAKVCDEDTLKLGLMSMFESVEPITEELLKNRL